jgi:short-subunit dehydrogenase
VSCLAPGPVYTKPEIVAETKKQLGKFGDKIARPPQKVGEKAVRKTLKGKMIIVPGFLANMMSGILRILPKKTSASIYNTLGKG